jgi:outer membrane biosynthesis protein TonB
MTEERVSQIQLANDWAKYLTPNEKKRVFGGEEPSFDKWWPSIGNPDKIHEYNKWKDVCPGNPPKPVPEPKPEPEPVPVVEAPKPAPKPAPEPEPAPAPVPAPKPKANPKPKPEPAPELEPIKYNFDGMTMTELRKFAKDHGVLSLPRKKKDVITKLENAMN